MRRLVAFALVALVALVACSRGAERGGGATTATAVAATSTARPLPTPPAAAAVVAEAPHLAGVDDAIASAIARGEIPGAVCLVVHDGEIVVRKAYGDRAIEPAREAMTVDTVFDLASLTKPLATGLAIMSLVESKRLRLDDRVATILPGFTGEGKAEVTVSELLLHTSGLPADTGLDAWRGGRDVALARALATPLEAKPAERMRYSDVGFVVLGAIVEKITGERLDAYVARTIYAPLGLRDTRFGADATRAAPTEKRDGKMLRGTVHDPRAAALGGVAGHAGLFSTADDLAKLGRALIGDGVPGAISKATAQLMMRRTQLPGTERAYAWDLVYSFARDKRSIGVAHTGFTGTWIMLDPATQTVAVLLTSRLHPAGKGDAKPVRHAVIEALQRAYPWPGELRAGLDVLVAERFARLRGKRVGLVTNAAAIDRERVPATRRFAEAHVDVARVFTPEHGLGARVEGAGDEAVDADTKAPITRLYGAHARPRASDFAGLDVVAFDLPNVNARFFTYVTTLGYVMEAAAEAKVPLLVLDRPPITGAARVEGPELELAMRSFTGYAPLPVSFGMTNGELAKWFARGIPRGVDLSVVEMRGYDRAKAIDEQGFPFAPPSPNLRSVDAAILYPGLALLERTNVSVGRGTDHPFEVVGAPWIEPKALAGFSVPGLVTKPTSFTPTEGPFAGETCAGLAFTIADRSALSPVDLGLALGRALITTQGGRFRPKSMEEMLANHGAFTAFMTGGSLDDMKRPWRFDVDGFAERRPRLYP